MDKLNILKKIYNYGETLSSEELNQIVSYINSSITAINTLIDKNNGINTSHSEVRYKNSSQQPNAPQTGTDGTSDGWSATYAFPDTSNGEITWMSICFVSGDNVYGAWSTPVCVTWSNVRGLQGQQGQSGIRGSFKSRVFKRQNTRPDTPTGGTYDNPVPPGWSDGVPDGQAIIWSSSCTFYGNGLSSGWSLPAPESDSTTLDIEFSPNNIKPDAPLGNIPYSNHESEGWYDSNSANFNNVGRMIWRAERKVSNGAYDGDWVITRIYGEKGDRGDTGLAGGHYEFRYNNFTPTENASKPTKPETGSNGTSGGWSTSQTDLTDEQIRAGTATWMTQCYLSETGIFGIWSPPIRITGSNGANGEDGTEVEFIYYRNNTGVTPPTPPTTQVNDWPRHLDGQGNSVGYDTITVNNQTYTWYDNPQGVTEDMTWEFVCMRSKVNNSWSEYSPPAVWSKWGEKGMDGDGFEYIFKRFQTVQNWANITGDDNPANWKTNHPTEFQNIREYTGPSGKEWSDDPVGINETYKYEYVSVRRERDGVWQDYSSPTLWSGIPGGKTEYRYAKYKGTTNNPKPTKPSAGTDGTTSPWSASEVSISEAEFKEGYKVWMTQCFKTNEGTYGTWSNPIRISGANGLDGEDGSDVEFIYKRQASATPPSTPTSVNTDDYVPEGWTDNPSGVTSSEKYEFVAVREKPAGNNQSWGAYTVALWSKWGEKGMDGDGYEYIYKHFSSEQTWGANDNNPNNWAANQNREYYGPSGYEWSDNPTGVDSTNKFEYVSTRHRVDGTWQKFSTPVLWSNYAEAGASVQGPQGKLGPMSYLAGIWDPTKTYTKTETKNPIVYYAPNNSYYYLVGTPPVSSQGNNDNPTTSNKWAQAENYNMVFTDILFVNQFAKFGSFIVNNDWLITRHGTIYEANGTPHDINEEATWTDGNTTYDKNTAYTAFYSDNPFSDKVGVINFVPNAAIDARTGVSYFNEAHVKGEINATNGIFSGDVYANQFRAGNTSGFNITVESDSINFNYGSTKQAWFSTKKLQMNANGIIEDAQDDAPQGFYLYMISPKNGNVVTIDFDNLSFSEITNSNVQIPVHTTTVLTITAGSNGTAIVSNRTIYYKNIDSNGNSIPNQYYWNSECTSAISSYLNNDCYVLTKSGYIILNENYVQGGSPYVLRPVSIYQPAMYVPQSGKIIGTGNRVYVVDYSSNNTNLKFATSIGSNSSAMTLYNSSVYSATTGSTLNNGSGVMYIAPESSGISVFYAYKSNGSTIPTQENKISIFTPTGSTPMSKSDYSA